MTLIVTFKCQHSEIWLSIWANAVLILWVTTEICSIQVKQTFRQRPYFWACVSFVLIFCREKKHMKKPYYLPTQKFKQIFYILKLKCWTQRGFSPQLSFKATLYDFPALKGKHQHNFCDLLTYKNGKNATAVTDTAPPASLAPPSSAYHLLWQHRLWRFSVLS